MKNHHFLIITATFLTTLGLSLITGCASTGTKGGSSTAASANTSEDTQIQSLISKMNDAGYEFNKINNPVIDEIGNLMATQFKRQQVLLESYHARLKQHKDVASFLHINKGKDQNELKKEIARFDSQITNESEKIGPKLEAFENATSEINEQNFSLAKQLAATGVKIAALKDKGLDKLVTASGFQAIAQLNNVKDAFNEISDRWSIGEEANKFIEADQQKLNNVKEMQKLVSAKSM